MESYFFYVLMSQVIDSHKKEQGFHPGNLTEQPWSLPDFFNMAFAECFLCHTLHFAVMPPAMA